MKKTVMILITMMTAVSLAAGSISAGALDEIQKRGTLLVGLDPGYMPFELRNQKGEIIGFDVDMAKRMAKKMGVKLEIVPTAWDGIIPALLTSKFDIIMSAMTMTQERNMSINFASPYIIIGQTVLVNKKLENEVKSYKDLNDPKYTISSKLGTTGEQAAKRMIPKAAYIAYDTEQEAVLEVVNGKIDAFVYDMPYNAAAFVQRGGGKLYHLAEPFTYEPLAWAVRKGDFDFINWLNNFMLQVKNDGTYDKIYRKWFEDDAWMKELQK
ncbi:MAG: amino acid ABC transporter substrate-binding protein [Proteobacteria bacterium]|nr:MAG: amino acid ABC transporter substrate-binding protein [Pseudomonadota bacterium]